MTDTIENRPKTELLRRLYLALNRLSTATIAVSPATVERLREWGVPGTADMPVINPPIDITALRAAARADLRADGIPVGARVIGAVGRLEAVKRFGPLIAALAPLLGDGVHLLVVGDGPDRAALEAQAAALGVGSAVHLTGSRGDVPALLAAMDVFVSPSRDETFGMAVVEAAVAGLPVVYAQCPAFDGLDLPPRRFRAVSSTSDEPTERGELAAAVGGLLTAGRDVDAVPAVLEQRYGAPQTAALVDALYERLTGHAGLPRPRRRRPRWPGPFARRRHPTGSAAS